MSETEQYTPEEIIKDLVDGYKKIQSTIPGKYIEVYPQSAKGHPKLKAYCDARVKAGTGVYAEPLVRLDET